MRQHIQGCLAFTIESDILAALWVYVRIQSPFLIFCSYGLIKRFDKIASPFLFIPSVIGICSLYYFVGFKGADFPVFFSHIPLAGALLIITYLMLRKFGYSNP